ncbi:helix-turn-helix domain-containing protein [Nonomuraea sp. NEAU-A123]|uniref:helix-turn-helix domain-containing protein n=1 Tax=Nonomuraea sp. NEAU-A123 TaxID=2839649 RepID=UPI001BE49249|nr:helix-turn-helix domain-containing protein [Nonomuraea sp. NEAU-A123]MBT2235560.1 helix-turn-helix domain-containing protein [Nonomuraea sp. NEAU-A123]
MDPNGPIADFAIGLRALREHAGLTYSKMRVTAYYCESVLSTAANGRTLPSWKVTAAYVEACGGCVIEWRGRWERACLAWESRSRGST